MSSTVTIKGGISLEKNPTPKIAILETPYWRASLSVFLTGGPIRLFFLLEGLPISCFDWRASPFFSLEGLPM